MANIIVPEYILTPDIFDGSCYDENENVELCLGLIENTIKHSVIRNYCAGNWSKFIEEHYGSTNLIPIQSVLKELFKHRQRLRFSPVAELEKPDKHQEWLSEALQSHKADKLSGVVSTKKILSGIEKKNVNQCISDPKAGFLGDKFLEGQFERKIDSFLSVFNKALECSNNLTYIDPYFSLIKETLGYKHHQKFHVLIDKLIKKDTTVIVRIHTSGKAINSQANHKTKYERLVFEFKSSFKDSISEYFKKYFAGKKLRLECHFWHHKNILNRYLLTELFAFSLGHGLGEGERGKEQISMINSKRIGELETQYHHSMKGHFGNFSMDMEKTT